MLKTAFAALFIEDGCCIMKGVRGGHALKKIEVNEQGVKEEVTLRASGMPYALAGVVFFLIAGTNSVCSLGSYIWPTVAAIIAFRIGKGIWKGTKTVREIEPDTGDAQCDALLKEAREALAAIRKTDDGIADEGVSQCIREIDQICRQILLKLEEQPELYSQLRTFLRYYLPTTRKILDNRALIEQRGTMDDENARAVCERTDRLLPEIRRAFQKQLDALNEHNYLDVEVEMDVLEGMMKGDGLAGGASAAATQTK